MNRQISLFNLILSISLHHGIVGAPLVSMKSNKVALTAEASGTIISGGEWRLTRCLQTDFFEDGHVSIYSKLVNVDVDGNLVIDQNEDEAIDLCIIASFEQSGTSFETSTDDRLFVNDHSGYAKTLLLPNHTYKLLSITNNQTGGDDDIGVDGSFYDAVITVAEPPGLVIFSLGLIFLAISGSGSCREENGRESPTYSQRPQASNKRYGSTSLASPRGSLMVTRPRPVVTSPSATKPCISLAITSRVVPRWPARACWVICRSPASVALLNRKFANR
jgi:hypothetical protein